MSSSPSFIADFDSASGMLRALGRCLEGHDFQALGQSQAYRPLANATRALPLPLRKGIFALGGWLEAVPPGDLSQVRADELARWAVETYPSRRYPAAMLGSSNGALIHLCAALGIPWLPQTWLIPVHQRNIDPDQPRQSLKAGMDWAPPLLQANPELQLHHMHDANQDRLMIQHMSYFRVKRLRLGRIYEEFLADAVEPGGTIFVADCRLSWPVTRVGSRHVFQHGGYGGADPEEYLSGSPRVSEFLRREGSPLERWDSPPPDETAPEAEWGMADPFADDVERFARERGFRVVRIRFERPEDPSPLVADLYRWWYERAGCPADRLIAESFILMDPWQILRTGSVPFWCTFPVESSATALDRYLKARPAFERIHVMLFAHGMNSIGLAPLERWRAVMARGREFGGFLGVDESAFPADFATFARYSKALRQLPDRSPVPGPLTLDELETFLAEAGGRFDVDWQSVPL